MPRCKSDRTRNVPARSDLWHRAGRAIALTAHDCRPHRSLITISPMPLNHWKRLPRFVVLLASIITLAFPQHSLAHAPSDTFLTFTISPTNLTGRWQVAVRDLQHALG